MKIQEYMIALVVLLGRGVMQLVSVGGVLDVDGVETCREHWELLSDQYRYMDPIIMLDELQVKGT